MDTNTTDESQPLLRSALERGEEDATQTKYVVDFDPKGDPDNPIDWPTPFKWSIVLLLAFMGFTV
jgi:hypothetical protein